MTLCNGTGNNNLLKNQNPNFTGIVQTDTGQTITIYANSFPTFKIGAAGAGNAGVSTPYAFTSNIAAGSNAYKSIDGARWMFSTADASAYLARNAENVINTPGKLTATTGLGVGNSAAATTLGSVTKKMEVFDASGTSLGFVPIYDAIT